MKLIDDPRAKWPQLLTATVQVNIKHGSGHHFRTLPPEAETITSTALVRDWTLKAVNHVKFHPLDYLAFTLSNHGDTGTVPHELQEREFSERLCQQLNQQCKDMPMERIGQLDLDL